MAITIEHKQYGGYARHLSVRNGALELILSTEFGPRVVYMGVPGGRNLFAEVSPHSQAKPTAYGDDWHIYGGHRLWYAPEDDARSYFPDNAPVQVEETPRGARVVQEVEPHTGLEKSLSLTLSERAAHAVVSHQLTNRGADSWELAPWALSAMAPGGVAIFPHEPFRPHPEALAPARPMVLWPFTRMSDPRWVWGDRYILLRQDPGAPEPQKVGLYDRLGYMAYALEGQLFIKCHTPRPGAHADFGCNVQTFTNELFLELESLGPLVQLAPGQSVEHIEHWFLFDGFRMPTREAELEQALAPKLAEVRRLMTATDR